MAEALQNSGRDIFYSLCEWGRENPAVWAAGISHSWRVSGDIRGAFDSFDLHLACSYLVCMIDISWYLFRILDDWDSIMSRAAIDAPLWRYAGPGGWNDPDMLEVGNGGCSMVEYQTHFSLWAMLKAPLIIGNDVRTLQASSEGDAVLQMLSNNAVIAVNQDPLGRQARRIWSDATTLMTSKEEDRLIATKCATGAADSVEDDLKDQQWIFQPDGTIRSDSTGRCLSEQLPHRNSSSSSSHDNLNKIDLSLGPNLVTAVDCSLATKWANGKFEGGSVVSQSSGKCLEVAKMSQVPIIDGKRIQTGDCQVYVAPSSIPLPIVHSLIHS